MTIAAILKDLILSKWPVAIKDPIAGFTCYGKRKLPVARGEFDVMHVLFEPVLDGAISEVECLIEDGANSRSWVLPLPADYSDLLLVTNGGFFFAGNLILYGLGAERDIPSNHLVLHRPSELLAANVLTRHKGLHSEHIHLGTYFATQQLLVFDPEKGTVNVTAPFKKEIARTWVSVAEYLAEEFYRLNNLFDSAGCRTSDDIGPR